MSRDPLEPDDEEPPEPRGHLSTTRPGAIAGFWLTGLVLGWVVRPLFVELGRAAPQVTWLQGAALYFVAGIIGWVAWATHRTLHRVQARLRPHEAVNRLVLAKASALAGALVAGGYLGYALSWVGIEAELAGQRAGHSVVAAGGAVLVVVASLFLERACRVRDDEDQP